MEGDEMRLESVYLLQISTIDDLASPRVERTDTSRWHLIDVMHDRTWCGLSIAHDAQRQLWSDTVVEERCELCLLRMRHPV